MDFPFVGQTYVAASITQNDEECINWYAEIDYTKQQGERGVIALYPTPGLVTQVQLPNQLGVRAMHVMPGGTTLLAASGNTLYSLNRAFSATAVGTLNTSSGPMSITDNGVSAYLCDGPNRYYYTPASSTFAAIADGGFTGANTVDIVDNFIIYNNPNSNQWGATGAGTVTSAALSVGAFLSAPGFVVGLIADHRQVYLLGEVASEVSVDVGASPFPFQVIAGTTMQHGCVARGSIARLGESFAFLAQDTRGHGVVVHMNGYQPKRISTFAVEQAMSGYSIISDAIAYTYQQSGHEFYVLNFPTADATWCYDLATEMWHKRAWRDSFNVLHRHRGNCAVSFNNQVIVGDWENGKIYEFSQTNYTDDGDMIPCIRRCKHITSGLNRVFHQSLQLQFQPGVGIGGFNDSFYANNYMSVTNSATSYATTPDSAALSITGDIDIVAYIAPDSWNAFQWICDKSDGSNSVGNQNSYLFFLGLGHIALAWSANGLPGGGGSAASSATVLPFVDANYGWVRATLDVNDGLGNYVVKFYTSSDPSTTAPASVAWTQYGNTVTQAGVTSIFDGTAALRIGNEVAFSAPLVGKIGGVYIYSGIGGTLAASFNPSNGGFATVGASTVTSTLTREVYTLNGTASIKYDVATQATGQYLASTQGNNPQAMLHWSNDGGFTFGNEHWTTIGKMGAYKNRAIWRQMGEARDRVYEVQVTDPVYRVIVSAELDANAGAY